MLEINSKVINPDTNESDSPNYIGKIISIEKMKDSKYYLAKVQFRDYTKDFLLSELVEECYKENYKIAYKLAKEIILKINNINISKIETKENPYVRQSILEYVSKILNESV